MGRTRILVIAKFRILGESLSSCLEREGSGRYEITTSSCFVSPKEHGQPDVVLLSCAHDCPAGIEAMRALHPRSKLIVVTRSPDLPLQAEWLRSGVAGIIDEADPSMDLHKLCRAILAVLAGEVWAPRDLLGQIALNKVRAVGDELERRLTRREHDILGLLHVGLKNAEIGDRLCIAEKTVKTHLTSIYRKLDVENRVQAVLKSRELRRAARRSESHGPGRGHAAKPTRRLPVLSKRLQ